MGDAQTGKVTIWYRKTKKGWEHNHIEDGWVFNKRPIPVADTLEGREQQFKAWKGAEWKRTWAFNNNGKLEEIVREE